MAGRRENLLLPGVERWPSDQPAVELRHVTKRFGSKTIVDDLSLTVETGKTTVIVGASGSGKSVLLRLMNGLTLPDEGEVLLFGRDLRRIGERERTLLRKRCTMVFQNYALIDSLTVLENIAFPLVENTRLPKKKIHALVDELLEMLELPHARGMMPSALSGGMKKRVSFARAVVTNPEVVLFDEPTTGLDPIMIEFVDDLIIRTQREFEITSVIISHDMASNQRLADRVAMLSGGCIVAFGDFDEVRRDPQPAVQAFMANISTERLSSVPSGADDPAQGEAEETPVPVVQVRELHKSFGDNHVLKGIDLDIYERQITVVIGGSGSGKSVLIKHILGLIRPDRGEVNVYGRPVHRLGGRELRDVRARIGLLFQGAALFDSMSVRENIAFPLVERRGPERQSKKEIRRRVEEIAERLKVPELLDQYPAALSGGQRKRVGLARAIVTRPDIMIYDEPTTGQDPIMMARVDEMIVEAAETFDITSIVISHDMPSTFRIADRIAMIYKGNLAAVGTPDELKASADDRVRAFIFAGTDVA